MTLRPIIKKKQFSEGAIVIKFIIGSSKVFFQKIVDCSKLEAKTTDIVNRGAANDLPKTRYVATRTVSSGQDLQSKEKKSILCRGIFYKA